MKAVSRGKIRKKPTYLFSDLRIRRFVEGGLNRALLLVERAIKENLTGRVLKVQTGRLRSSIHHSVKVTARSARGVIGTNVVYARIHEYGGVITPKRVRYLTIPFPGVKGFAREYQNTFVAKSIIFQRVSGKKIRPLFLLRSSVVIPERPYVRPAVEETRGVVEGIIRTILTSVRSGLRS